MKVQKSLWFKKAWQDLDNKTLKDAGLVLVFGETDLLKSENAVSELRTLYPVAHILGCSTSGEIYGTSVRDDVVTATAIQFEGTPLKHASLRMSEVRDSYEAGEKLAASLPHQNLNHVLVLSAGLGVNGSDLVRGLASKFPANVTITGGLAGDQGRFQETLVIAGTQMYSDMIAVVGLYGSAIEVSSASLGGWDVFGPERRITKSKGNILYELDGKSALQLYKTYLGDHAKDLPASALLFPLSLKSPDNGGLVRSVLGVDEKEQSLIFAGDVPEGISCQLMRANFDRLIEGAIGAAETCQSSIRGSEPSLAILISCVGRKIILKQRVEEEVEGVRDIFGETTMLTGFYSYGEISPFTPNARCELHNQTMTITTLKEKSKKDAA